MKDDEQHISLDNPLHDPGMYEDWKKWQILLWAFIRGSCEGTWKK